MDTDAMVKALRTIVENCHKQEDCTTCLWYSNWFGGCMIQCLGSPKNWDLEMAEKGK